MSVYGPPPGAEPRPHAWIDCDDDRTMAVNDLDPAFQPPEPFRCETARDASTAWVRPFGELDLDTAHEVDEQLTSARADGADRLVLDLRGLTFMDSTGLRLVIRWDTAGRDQGFAFAIVPGVDVVQRVFQLTGMDAHLSVADPPPEA
jgi:anti-sigma B factor antagonist